jgi:RNA recognition motif-containing protein
MELFIGNLSRDVSRSELYTLFSTYGAVQYASIPLNPVTRRPMGYGIVRLRDGGSADRAVKELDGLLLAGRLIRVSYRRPGLRKGQASRASERRWP